MSIWMRARASDSALTPGHCAVHAERGSEGGEGRPLGAGLGSHPLITWKSQPFRVTAARTSTALQTIQYGHLKCTSLAQTKLQERTFSHSQVETPAQGQEAVGTGGAEQRPEPAWDPPSCSLGLEEPGARGHLPDLKVPGHLLETRGRGPLPSQRQHPGPCLPAR